jgi:hypothetical protein
MVKKYLALVLLRNRCEAFAMLRNPYRGLFKSDAVLRNALTLLSLSLLCYGCKQYDTKVKGEAVNAKAGAVIISNTGSYYLDEMYRWEKHQIGKCFVVKGNVTEAYSDTSRYVQGVANKKSLENFKIRRVWIFKRKVDY